MINSGKGAYIDPATKTKLSGPELKLLKLMMKTPHIGWSRGDWATQMKIDPQILSGHISVLKGCGLVKSALDDSTWTDEERIMLKGKSNFYWIGEAGQPIRKRAQYVLDANGSLLEIRENKLNFGLKLWPDNGREIVTIKGMIIAVTPHQLVLNFNTTEEKLTKLAELGDQKEVMINIESM